MNDANSKGIDALSAGNGAQGLNENEGYISNIIIIYLLSYTFLLIVLSFLAYSWRFGDIYLIGDLFKDTLIRHFAFIGSAGGLGGIVYCMRGFYEHKTEGNFDTKYLSWYFFRPIISTITGIIVYFLLYGYLMAPEQNDQKIDNVMFLCSVAFLAGFGFTQFYCKIDDLVSTLFHSKEQKKFSIITWNNPADTTYGTKLSDSQLDATASVPGSFDYSPKVGTLLDAGTHKLHVCFTPTDSAKYETASKDVIIKVLKATPTITWNKLANITSGTLLDQDQLNAKAIAVDPNDYNKTIEITAGGSFTYTLLDNETKVDVGDSLIAGMHKLRVDFTLPETANYSSATRDFTIIVNKATPTITWATDVTFGAELPDPQGSATATDIGQNVNVPGTFTGVNKEDKLLAGDQQVTVTFVPNDSDSSKYNPVTQQVKINVKKATPTIIWNEFTTITHGTRLGKDHLNAKALDPNTNAEITDDGSFTYTLVNGAADGKNVNEETVLDPGLKILKTVFTPKNAAANYTPVSKDVEFNVLREEQMGYAREPDGILT